MRERFFRWCLHRLRRKTPEPLLRLQLQILCHETARAFGVPSRNLLFLPWREGLRRYALFTLECSGAKETQIKKETASQGEIKEDAALEKLYHRFYRLGRRLSLLTGFTREEDKRELVFYLYQGIGIRMEGCLPGEVEVPSCFFQGFYSPAQCALMSNLDSGLIGGIFGGGRVRFSRRLTEGCSSCRAVFPDQDPIQDYCPK